MAKVVVTDMDATLLNEKHDISEPSLAAIKKLYEADIRFIISTRRHYISAMDILGNYKLICDYILANGAEIRGQDGRILKQIPMDDSKFEEILYRIKDFPVAVTFCSNEYDYMLGPEDSIRRDMPLQAQYFLVREIWMISRPLHSLKKDYLILSVLIK